MVLRITPTPMMLVFLTPKVSVERPVQVPAEAPDIVEPSLVLRDVRENSREMRAALVA